MVSTQRRIPLVKRGAAVALAATLAVGSIPAVAFVQEAVTGSGPVAMAAQTGGETGDEKPDSGREICRINDRNKIRCF